MKKFAIVFLMSCVLSYIPTIFGAENKVGTLSVLSEHGYCYRKLTEPHSTPLAMLAQAEDDHFKLALDTIKKQTLEDIQEKIQTRSDNPKTSDLPIFTVRVFAEKHSIQIINPKGKTTDYFSKPLHEIFSGLESGKQSVVLVGDDNEKPVAILYSLQETVYNPNTSSEEKTSNVSDISQLTAQQPKATLTNDSTAELPASTPKPPSRTWTQTFKLWTARAMVGMIGFYTVSKLGLLNKDLAPLMEAKLSLFFNRLLDSWQNTHLRA